MALGPNVIHRSATARAELAEPHIDKAIEISRTRRVIVYPKLLGLTREDWETILRPKYLAAGWKKAEWTSDQRDGDFIDLDAN